MGVLAVIEQFVSAGCNYGTAAGGCIFGYFNLKIKCLTVCM
jgi:hypothetical protein